MDPYLGAFGPWRDFHHRFLTYTADALQPVLKPKYRVRIEERLIAGYGERSSYPDLCVVREPEAVYAVATPPEEKADDPVVVRVPWDAVEPHQIFIQILRPDKEDQVVTVIELLSPSNKAPGEARRKYEIKQQEILSSEVNLVEIDLLLDGAHVLAVPQESLTELKEWDYLVSVSRGADRSQFELYPIPLPQRLPRILVPLLPEDKGVVLNLRALFSQCYDRGGYADELDYSQRLSLSLSKAHETWVDSLLREKGLRSQQG